MSNTSENAWPGVSPGIAASGELGWVSGHVTGYPAKLARFLIALGGLTFFPLSLAAITYEEWAGNEFGSIEHPDAAPDLDPDADGLTNIYEYAFMSDPEVSNASPVEGMVFLHTDNQKYLAIEFPQRPEATDLIYEVRASEAMAGICVAGTPFLSENGIILEDEGLVEVNDEAMPRRLTVIDPAASVESGVFRGFLQVFVALSHPEADISFVSVGDPGKGGVEEAFEIGEFEVTNAQYVVFLNAVASEDDGRMAFSGFMESQPEGGIRRHGSFGNYTYSVKPGMEDKPVAFVRFWAACRFCNWLHNGRPLHCRTMTQFNTEDGAYDLTHADTLLADQVVRKPGASFFVPSDEEWVKAAHYDPVNDRLWTQGTQSDTSPIKATADSAGNIDNDTDNIANYHRMAIWDSENDGVSEPNVTTVGSGGPGSRSFYGAADMSGNIAEWTDTVFSNWARIQRGGSWNHVGLQIERHYRFPLATFPNSTKDTGFRIARPASPPPDGGEDSG